MKQVIVPSEPDKNGIIVLKENDYVHLVSVLRKKNGTQLEIRTPCGNLLRSEITEINRRKKTLSLRVLPQESSPASGGQNGQDNRSGKKTAEDFPCIILMQWVLKNAKMDLVIRQASEIGAAYILPVIGEYSTVKKQNSLQTERHIRIIREARQQSGSPVPTKILPPLTIDEALEKCAELTCGKETVMLASYENNTANNSLYPLLHKTTNAVVVAVGAEGGISAEEINKLRKAGFHEIHFKTNILRAETAALYTLAAVQSALAEADKWQ